VAHFPPQHIAYKDGVTSDPSQQATFTVRVKAPNESVEWNVVGSNASNDADKWYMAWNEPHLSFGNAADMEGESVSVNLSGNLNTTGYEVYDFVVNVDPSNVAMFFNGNIVHETNQHAFSFITPWDRIRMFSNTEPMFVDMVEILLGNGLKSDFVRSMHTHTEYVNALKFDTTIAFGDRFDTDTFANVEDLFSSVLTAGNTFTGWLFVVHDRGRAFFPQTSYLGFKVSHFDLHTMVNFHLPSANSDTEYVKLDEDTTHAAFADLGGGVSFAFANIRTESMETLPINTAMNDYLTVIVVKQDREYYAMYANNEGGLVTADSPIEWSDPIAPKVTNVADVGIGNVRVSFQLGDHGVFSSSDVVANVSAVAESAETGNVGPNTITGGEVTDGNVFVDNLTQGETYTFVITKTYTNPYESVVGSNVEDTDAQHSVAQIPASPNITGVANRGPGEVLVHFDIGANNGFTLDYANVVGVTTDFVGSNVNQPITQTNIDAKEITVNGLEESASYDFTITVHYSEPYAYSNVSADNFSHDVPNASTANLGMYFSESNVYEIINEIYGEYPPLPEISKYVGFFVRVDDDNGGIFKANLIPYMDVIPNYGDYDTTLVRLIDGSNIMHEPFSNVTLYRAFNSVDSVSPASDSNSVIDLSETSISKYLAVVVAQNKKDSTMYYASYANIGNSTPTNMTKLQKPEDPTIVSVLDVAEGNVRVDYRLGNIGTIFENFDSANVIATTSGGSNVDTSITIEGAAPYEGNVVVHGLTQGAEYTFTIINTYSDPIAYEVETLDDNKSTHTVAELPDKPSIVNVFDVTEGNVRIQYRLGTNQFFQVENIGSATLEYANTNGGSGIHDFTESVTESGNIDVDGLVHDGNVYTFTIDLTYESPYEYNIGGNTTHMLVTLPDIPTIANVVDIGIGNVRVGFNLGNVHTFILANVVLRYENANIELTSSDQSNKYTDVTGLVQGNTYSFEIINTYTKPFDYEIATIAPTDHEVARLPEPPRIYEVLDIDYGNVYVDFYLGNHGSFSNIIGYVANIVATSDERHTIYTQIVSETTSDVEITGFLPGNVYVFTITKTYESPYQFATPNVWDSHNVTRVPNAPMIDVVDVAEGNVRIDYKVFFVDKFDKYANISIDYEDTTVVYNVYNQLSIRPTEDLTYSGFVYVDGLMEGNTYQFYFEVDYKEPYVYEIANVTNHKVPRVPTAVTDVSVTNTQSQTISISYTSNDDGVDVGTVNTTYSITSTDGGYGDVIDSTFTSNPEEVGDLELGKTYTILIQKTYINPYTGNIDSIPSIPQVTGYVIPQAPSPAFDLSVTTDASQHRKANVTYSLGDNGTFTGPGDVVYTLVDESHSYSATLDGSSPVTVTVVGDIPYDFVVRKTYANPYPSGGSANVDSTSVVSYTLNLPTNPIINTPIRDVGPNVVAVDYTLGADGDYGTPSSMYITVTSLSSNVTIMSGSTSANITFTQADQGNSNSFQIYKVYGNGYVVNSVPENHIIATQPSDPTIYVREMYVEDQANVSTLDYGDDGNVGTDGTFTLTNTSATYVTASSPSANITVPGNNIITSLTEGETYTFTISKTYTEPYEINLRDTYTYIAPTKPTEGNVTNAQWITGTTKVRVYWENGSRGIWNVHGSLIGGISFYYNEKYISYCEYLTSCGFFLS
jgi:hypothetical protein